MLLVTTHANAGEFSASVGNFDSSDKFKKTSMIDLTYGFTEKNIDTSIGQIKPMVGVFLAENKAGMIYAGGKIDYKLGMFIITPSFTPGFYSEGDGKDMGNVLEFKSQLNIGLDLENNSILSLGFSHVSNGNLGDKNPGADTFLFNFSKQF